MTGLTEPSSRVRLARLMLAMASLGYVVEPAPPEVRRFRHRARCERARLARHRRQRARAVAGRKAFNRNKR